MTYRIGVDVGGTNTDAVLLNDNLEVVEYVKVHTTYDIETGIYEAIKKVVDMSSIDKNEIKYAMLGTTYCTNAIVERKRLNKVGVIRIAKPATTAIPPFSDWPNDLKKEVEFYSEIISGGYEFDGRILEEISKKEVLEFCKKVNGKVGAIAITGVFSPINKDQEIKVSEWIKEELGDIPISLSSEIGNIGILERENATILNSALKEAGKIIVKGFNEALNKLDLKCEIYFSQNDGTLMDGEYTEKYPIFTIGCGVTNSIRGASYLSGVKNGIVLDVGGTTTDIGVLKDGFPRESSIAVNIGGVHTNFRMPDMISIGVAGGTIVSKEEDKITVGPESVGYKITEESIIFGGNILTLTDVSAKLNNIFPDKEEMISKLDYNYCEKIQQLVMDKIENSIDQMKTNRIDVPVILTGGGSIIVSDEINGASEVIKPAFYDSANAVGAALGMISGEVESIYKLDDISRKDAIENAKQNAINKAKDLGAKEDTINIINIEDIPLTYLPGNATLVKAKAVGKFI